MCTVRYEFPNDVITDRTHLNNIVVGHSRSDCSDSFAYCADENDRGLIVFDYAKRESWRISNQYFYPFPGAGSLSSGNITIDLMSGIFGLALGESLVNSSTYFCITSRYSRLFIFQTHLPNLTENYIFTVSPVFENRGCLPEWYKIKRWRRIQL